MLPNQTALPVTRFATFIVATILCYAPLSFAQEATMQTPPQYHGMWTHVDGVFVTPVPNEPLTAVAELTSTQTLGDGNHIHQTTTAHMVRDSEGRTRREQSLNGLGALGSTSANKIGRAHV